MVQVVLVLLGLVLPTLGGYIPPGPRYACPKEPIYIYPCTCVKGTDEGLHIRCENTNLASASLAFVNLGNEAAPIEELIIYKCDIGKIIKSLINFYNEIKLKKKIFFFLFF